MSGSVLYISLVRLVTCLDKCCDSRAITNADIMLLSHVGKLTRLVNKRYLSLTSPHGLAEGKHQNLGRGGYTITLRPRRAPIRLNCPDTKGFKYLYEPYVIGYIICESYLGRFLGRFSYI